MNSPKRYKRIFFIAIYTVLSAFIATTGGVLAQDDESPVLEEIEEILVTGTYVRRDVDSPSPILVVDRDEITNAPRSNIGEFFVTTTINSGNFFVNDSISQALSAASNVDLRGLGPQSTLVLLDGRRSVNHAIQNRQGNVFVDVNALLPGIMIDRIEILKDGAAALYGTDAVAGVVNFIPREDFVGIEVSGDYHVIEASGDDDLTLSGIWGAGNDRSNIVIGLEYKDRDPFRLQDRFEQRLIDNGLLSPFGLPGSFGKLLNIPGPPFFRDPLCGDPRLEEEIGNPAAPGVPGGPPPNACFNNNALARGVIGAEERLNGAAFATHRLTDTIELSAEFQFSMTDTRRVGGTFPILRSVPCDGVFIACGPLPVGSNVGRPIIPTDNPGNPFGQPVTGQFIRVLPNGLEEELFVDSDVWRTAFGVTHDISERVRWEANFVYARNEAQSARRDVIARNAALAVNGFGGANCDLIADNRGMGNCMFFNPFAISTLADPGDPLANSPEIIDFLLANETQDNTSKLLTVNWIASGEIATLPGGALGVAVGLEYRDEKFQIDFNDLANDGAFAFISQSFDMDAERDVWALFGEIVAPLHDTLELQIAGRFEDYGNGLDTFDPKVAALWRPIDSLAVRGSWGTSFRAPGLFQSFSRQTAAQQVVGFNTVSQTFQPMTPIAFIAGDPNLRPEDADTFNFGFTWDAIQNLTISADWWYFDFSDIITPESAQEIAASNLGEPDPRITRGPSGIITQMDLTFINAASLETTGLDFGGRYLWDAGNIGNVLFDAKATWIAQYDIRTAPDDPVIDGKGGRNFNIPFANPMPEWRFNFITNWTRGAHNGIISTRFLSGVEDDQNAASEDEGYVQVDLLYNYTWDTEQLGGPLTFSIGVNNVFDADPPVLVSDFFTVEQRLYDPRGRTWIFGLHKTLN